MRVGILDLINSEVGRRWDHRVYNHLITRQYISIMAQAISVWCRELGHEVFYATHFGQKNPEQLLPDDLDVVFISAFTRTSALAYALAKLYKWKKTLTVIGGPHAKAFPDDCLRFFDVAVQECDKSLIADILSSAPRGEIITSGRTLQEIPTVQERMPEIRASAFWRGKPYPFTSIPVLTSIGCPYTCDFCVESSKPYTPLPLDQLEADIRFIRNNLPGASIIFHDPNFGVNFDEVCSVLERVPYNGRRWYVMETSLSFLQLPKLEQLRDTGCLFIAPGVESWTAYSNKTGTGSKVSAQQKLERVVEHFKLIYEYIPGIQANFLFGLDIDEGDEPVELTKEFMARVPFVWPAISIPTPFGGTPIYKRYLDEGRILTSMPFTFYTFSPYLVTTVKNYSPVTYYEKLIEMFSLIISWGMLFNRLQTNSVKIRFAFLLKTFGWRQMVGEFRRILGLMKTDRNFRAFHEGESQILPEFYHYQFERLLGPYATLLSREDRQPMLLHTQHAPPSARQREDSEYSLTTE